MIYVDYNATTPLGSSARQAMERVMDAWGNPSSSHHVGRKALELLEQARSQVAEVNGVSTKEVVFTSGGSEANTAVLLGSYFSHESGFKILTSRVEHSSIRDTLPLIESRGGKVEYVPVLPNGELDFAAFEKQIRAFQPHLVSVMVANNETGVLFPIPEITKLCKELGVSLHTDAVQAFGKVSPSYWDGADFISISSHKVFGPKGTGALIVRNQKKLVSTHYGGAQEIKRRGGTENVLGIVGFGAACLELPSESDLLFMENLRNSFEKRLGSALDGVVVQGGSAKRIPNTSNIRFHGIPSEILLSALDLDGVCVSAGSACSSGSMAPSHVLMEMGLSKVEAKECIRFSWGKTSTEEEMKTVSDLIIAHVNRIRERRKAHA